MDLLLFVLDLWPEAAVLLGLDKELHLKARDTTALKRCKGPVINDVSLISRILDPLPLVVTKFTQPPFCWSVIG